MPHAVWIVFRCFLCSYCRLSPEPLRQLVWHLLSCPKLNQKREGVPADWRCQTSVHAKSPPQCFARIAPDGHCTDVYMHRSASPSESAKGAGRRQQLGREPGPHL
ncbi:hypothetical protein EDB89DRAFT_132457 [Lactarius sanguifluus]|nr:hypothetical protein EDB89DRAFT_132457 [Lactarius sanguifluus]